MIHYCLARLPISQRLRPRLQLRPGNGQCEHQIGSVWTFFADRLFRAAGLQALRTKDLCSAENSFSNPKRVPSSRQPPRNGQHRRKNTVMLLATVKVLHSAFTLRPAQPRARPLPSLLHVDLTRYTNPQLVDLLLSM
jgi:hypothetical protein